MSTNDLAWFKSSYSGPDGGSCVEVALSWQKSSYCDNASNNCIEIAPSPTAIHIRDSKDKDGPRLAVTSGVWRDFVAYAVGQG